MKIVYSGVCDIGLKRSVNQDSVFMFSENGMSLFVVADGMGGYTMGDIASRTIINAFANWADNFSPDFYQGNFSWMLDHMEKILEEANREIFSNYNQGQICGSTCVALFIYDEYYGIINVGDSRIYRKERFKITSMMKDDVWENRADVQQRLSKKEIKSDINYGKLLQAVGTKERVVLSEKTGLLKKGDTFLLCSDGLYKTCSERKLGRILRNCSENDMEISVKKMLDACYKGGADDNVSIIVVKCV